MNAQPDIHTMPLAEAWELFKVYAPFSDPAYHTGRFGRYLEFDINDFLRGHIMVKSKTGRVYIRGMSYPLKLFYTELEYRTKVIKRWLLQHTEGQSLFTLRKDTSLPTMEVTTPNGGK